MDVTLRKINANNAAKLVVEHKFWEFTVIQINRIKF